MRERSVTTCNTAEGATSAPVRIWKCAEGADFDFARVAGILDRYNFSALAADVVCGCCGNGL